MVFTLTAVRGNQGRVLGLPDRSVVTLGRVPKGERVTRPQTAKIVRGSEMGGEGPNRRRTADARTRRQSRRLKVTKPEFVGLS